MIANIRKVLDGMKELSGWKLELTETEGLEAFVTGGSLEMGRAKETMFLNATVYRDGDREGKKTRGSASAKIFPGASRDEIRSILSRISLTASGVVNPWFPLVGPGMANDRPKAKPETPFHGMFENIVPELQVEAKDGGKLSYAELILSRNRVRILNSEGIDESFPTDNGYFECAAQWKEPEREEVEIFSQLNFSEPEPGMLSSKILEALVRARDRAKAVPNTARNGLPVVLTGAAVLEFFSWFPFQVSARSIYRKLSVVKEGYRFQNDGKNCDPVTLHLEPELAGSPSTNPFDQDGFPLKPHLLIEGGTVKKLAGDIRHAYYLGIEPTGDQANFTVGAGSLELKDLEAEERLEITDFSDFQVDSVTGDFGGEIRLAYHCRNAERRPVTGGSVTGSMSSVLNSMRFSKATGRHENYFGPIFIRLENLSISAG